MYLKGKQVQMPNGVRVRMGKMVFELDSVLGLKSEDIFRELL
jgi:hypothetical protein